MFGSYGWGFSSLTGFNSQAYIIPESGTVYTHVNATDLANGTAKVGGAWTMAGAVPYNVGDFPRPSVGPFSDSNNFSQVSGGMSVVGPPFTTVVIWYGSANGAQQFMAGTEYQYIEVTPAGLGASGNGNVNNAPAQTPNAPPTINVSFGGQDSSGNLWAQTNGNPAVSVASAYPGSYATAKIGAYAGGAGYSCTSVKILEVYCSNQVPSQATFSSIYNSIKATLNQNYLIPEVGTVVTHVNATDLNAGTAKVGSVWTVNGTVPFNTGTSPRPSVGPFSDSNYFSNSLLSIPAPPFTVVLLVNTTSTSGGPVAFSATTSFYEQITNNLLGFSYNGTSTDPPNTVTSSTLNVILCGVDANGVVYAQVNNGTLAEGTGSATSAYTGLMLGRYANTGYSLGAGTIYELMVSTAVPSSAAFTSIYNAIVGNE